MKKIPKIILTFTFLYFFILFYNFSSFSPLIFFYSYHNSLYFTSITNYFSSYISTNNINSNNQHHNKKQSKSLEVINNIYTLYNENENFFNNLDTNLNFKSYMLNNIIKFDKSIDLNFNFDSNLLKNKNKLLRNFLILYNSINFINPSFSTNITTSSLFNSNKHIKKQFYSKKFQHYEKYLLKCNQNELIKHEHGLEFIYPLNLYKLNEYNEVYTSFLYDNIFTNQTLNILDNELIKSINKNVKNAFRMNTLTKLNTYENKISTIYNTRMLPIEEIFYNNIDLDQIDDNNLSYNIIESSKSTNTLIKQYFLTHKSFQTPLIYYLNLRYLTVVRCIDLKYEKPSSGNWNEGKKYIEWIGQELDDLDEFNHNYGMNFIASASHPNAMGGFKHTYGFNNYKKLSLLTVDFDLGGNPDKDIIMPYNLDLDKIDEIKSNLDSYESIHPREYHFDFYLNTELAHQLSLSSIFSLSQNEILPSFQLINNFKVTLDESKKYFISFIGGENPIKGYRTKFYDQIKKFNKRFKNYNNIFNVNLKLEKYSNYVKSLVYSDFCLMLEGDTSSSSRLFLIIYLECIPVVFSDNLRLPFEDFIDYSKAVIFLPQSLIQPYSMDSLIDFNFNKHTNSSIMAEDLSQNTEIFESDELKSLNVLRIIYYLNSIKQSSKFEEYKDNIKELKQFVLYNRLNSLSYNFLNPITLSLNQFVESKLKYCEKNGINPSFLKLNKFCMQLIDRKNIVEKLLA